MSSAASNGEIAGGGASASRSGGERGRDRIGSGDLKSIEKDLLGFMK